MNAIWRYEVEQQGSTHQVPEGATLLHAGLVRGAVCLWARVNPEAPRVPRRFQLLPTGAPFNPADGIYLGTVIDEPLVWHVFEVAP